MNKRDQLYKDLRIIPRIIDILEDIKMERGTLTKEDYIIFERNIGPWSARFHVWRDSSLKGWILLDIDMIFHLMNLGKLKAYRGNNE